MTGCEIFAALNVECPAGTMRLLWPSCASSTALLPGQKP